MPTHVVRIRRKNDAYGVSQIIRDCDVYIGRRCTQGGWNLKESIWHNPYNIKTYDIDTSLSMYRQYIERKIQEDPNRYDLSMLVGKSLGCWCGDGENVKCHGNVLVSIMRDRGLI